RNLLLQQPVAGAQDFFVFTLGKNNLFGFELRLLNHHAGDLVGFAEPSLQLLPVEFEVDGFLSYAGAHGSFGDCGCLPYEHARIKRLGDQVLATKFQSLDTVGTADRVRNVFLGQSCEGAGGRQLHLFIDGGGVHVQGAAEDERESQDVVNLVGIIGTASGHNDIVTTGLGIRVGDLRIGVGHGEYDGVGSHRPHHVRRHRTFHGEAEEHIRTLHDLSQRAQLGVMGESFLVRIHSSGAAFVDHTLGIAEDDVFALDAQADIVLGAGDARRPGAIDDQTNLVDGLAHNFQRIQQRGSRDDGGTMLVIMEDWDLHRLLQRLLDVEALRRFDVLQIDAAKSGFQQLAELDNLVGIMSVDFKVEHVHIGKAFKQDTLTFHDGLAGEGTDVSQAEDGSSVAYNGNQVALRGVFESIVGVLFDIQAWIRHSGGVSQAQVALRPARLGGGDFNFSRTSTAVVVECLLFRDGHKFPPRSWALRAPEAEIMNRTASPRVASLSRPPAQGPML